MDKKLRVDFYVVLGVILLSIPLILYFKVRPLTSALFFFVIPTIYLFLRKGKPVKELAAGSLLIGAGFGFIFDILASANNAWNELGSQLVFNYRIFGFLPADEPIWFILWALFILVFYEHFYEKHRTDKLSKKFFYIIIPALIVLFATILTTILNKNLLLFSHAYFFLTIPTLIPVLYVLKNRSFLVAKFLKTSVFFFFLFLVYELTAIKLGQWYFPGEYIGWVEIKGLKFPIEELIFWIGLSPFAVLALYEGFVDDDK